MGVKSNYFTCKIFKRGKFEKVIHFENFLSISKLTVEFEAREKFKEGEAQLFIKEVCGVDKLLCTIPLAELDEFIKRAHELKRIEIDGVKNAY